MILTLFASLLLAQAQSLEVLKGWKHLRTVDHPEIASLLGGEPEGLLLQQKPVDEMAPSVVVFDRTFPHTPNSISQWREILPRSKSTKRQSLRDRSYAVNGEPRYFAEISSDTGDSKMLSATVLGVVHAGKTRLYIYESTRETFQHHSPEVLALFRQISRLKSTTPSS